MLSLSLYHLFILNICIVNCFFHVPRKSKTACNEMEWCHLEKIGQTLHRIPKGGHHLSEIITVQGQVMMEGESGWSAYG